MDSKLDEKTMKVFKPYSRYGFQVPTTAQFTLVLDKEQLEDYRQEAKKRNITVSAYIKWLIERGEGKKWL